MLDYRDKVAVVTGAAYGIGRSLAIEMSKRGAKLLINDIHKDGLAETGSQIRSLGGEVVELVGDVSLNEDCQRIFDESIKAYGQVDILVNNAGVSALGDITEAPEQDLRWVTEVNYYSHFFMMSKFIPQMLKQGNQCQILNVCSIAGLINSLSAPIYFSTKHAAVSLSEYTYKWLRSQDANIDISIFCPGFVQTDMHLTDNHRPERYNDLSGEYYNTEKYKSFVDFNKQILQGGKPLDQAIDMVFEALDKGDFYILIEEEFDGFLRKQGEFIADKKRPIDRSDLIGG